MGGLYTGPWPLAVEALTPLELAVCSAPGGAGHPAKVIPPGVASQIVRGKGSNTRHVTNIMPEDDGSADSLLVVEVITPGGNTSSYPPHNMTGTTYPTRATSRRPTTTASTRRRVTASSASIPTTARSTRRFWSRMATW